MKKLVVTIDIVPNHFQFMDISEKAIVLICTYPEGPSLTEKDHHSGLRPNVTVSELSLSFERGVSHDTLTSEPSLLQH